MINAKNVSYEISQLDHVGGRGTDICYSILSQDGGGGICFYDGTIAVNKNSS